MLSLYFQTTCNHHLPSPPTKPCGDLGLVGCTVSFTEIGRMVVCSASSESVMFLADALGSVINKVNLPNFAARSSSRNKQQPVVLRHLYFSLHFREVDFDPRCDSVRFFQGRRLARLAIWFPLCPPFLDTPQFHVGNIINQGPREQRWQWHDLPTFLRHPGVFTF